MSYRTKRPQGGFQEILWAVFSHGQQITAWRRCKVATMAALRRNTRGNHRCEQLKRLTGLTIRGKRFITPPKEAA